MVEVKVEAAGKFILRCCPENIRCLFSSGSDDDSPEVLMACGNRAGADYYVVPEEKELEDLENFCRLGVSDRSSSPDGALTPQ